MVAMFNVGKTARGRRDCSQSAKRLRASKVPILITIAFYHLG